MSIYSSIRQVADSHFDLESRNKCVAIAVALALGTEYGNQAEDAINLDNSYLQNHFKHANETISTIGEDVLFDVRYALELTKQIYKLVASVRNTKVTLGGSNPDLFSSLFDVNGYLNEEEFELFKQNHTGIVAIYNIITQDEAK